MFSVNNTAYSKEYVDNHFVEIESLNLSEEWHGKRVAVACSDAYIWLCLCMYFRGKHIQLLPIHADLPKEGAFKKAIDSECDIFVWQDTAHAMDIADASLKTDQVFGEKFVGGLLQFSSGTTGAPKLIHRSWCDINEEIKYYNIDMKLDSDATIIVACPVTHSYGLICGFLASVDRGVFPHVVTGMNTAFLFSVSSRYLKPFIYSSPQLLKSLINLSVENKKGKNKLYGAMTSGTVLPMSWFNELKAHCENFYQQYGCSEAGCISISRNPISANDIGKPLDRWYVEVGDITSISEIVVINKVNDKHTNFSTNKEHSIYTQDVGYMDNQRLFFSSRIDDTIVVSGLNVYPTEIENIILQHPNVLDVIVFRSGPEDAQRIVCQYSGLCEIAPSELRRWCSQYLARYQWPTQFYFCDKIPRQDNGKVSRRELARLMSERECFSGEALN